MNVTITVAVRDNHGVTHTVEIVERSERFGATRAMQRARKALDGLVPPSSRAKAG